MLHLLRLIEVMDDPKTFYALINGFARHDYYDEVDISDEYLKSELYPDMSNEEFSHHAQKIRGLLKSMVSMNMDNNQLEAFLSSQMQKKERSITSEQAKMLTKFWTNHKTRIHESVIKNSTWSSTLKTVSWRIDVKNQTKSLEQLSVPCAIVELQLAKSQGSDEVAENIQFEMDETEVTALLQNLNSIEEQINKYTNLKK